MRKLNYFLNHIEEYIGVFSLIFSSFLVFVQVVLRYIFNYSLYWSEEVVRYLIIWFIFIGSSMAVREKAHAAVDVVVMYLPIALRTVFVAIANTLAIIFCVILIYSGMKNVFNVMEFGTVTPSLGIPMYIPYLAIPVGATLMLIRFIQILFQDMKGIWSGQKAVDDTMEKGTKI
ncbi:C4-dicarboxylate transporter DctQ subunit [Caldalkalibacillus uzonensis]|uniref:C4-dicarboxylate transporter DctQ subunit n=1 Tax=Caldalkalibacillus uzonensis TaxID=353224 RepID=A0ABU0CU06_9BACI|nr:TRAP transporter small permease [Caldalkalibacillus uzonensis]MDQ0339364.1 C4-dicarboxylate transporter DctQ subunit [Caldalkalibacillus uzonensis]